MTHDGPNPARREASDHPARHVRLMITCLCDAFYDDVARATVEILEALGCSVEVPEQQTCCGQPAFNAGDWDAARRVSRHTLGVFSGEGSVVVPSGSCARMTAHGALLLFERAPDREAAASLAERSFELADFIVNDLKIARFPGHFSGRVALHRSCHSRGTTYAESAERLLRSVDGLELVPTEEGEQCCGFGGTFSTAFPTISGRMGDLKLEHLLADAPDCVVSADMGCLLHLDGMAKRLGLPLRSLHLAQLLRDALRAGARSSPEVSS